ncbi:MAG: hypothetical protein VX777_08515 [Chlamydiota bacterium]|nr:hypothetical protein [Chlamydiota bacterium]
MINPINKCKLDFFNNLNEDYKKNNNLTLDKITFLLESCFEHISQDAKITTSLTFKELKHKLSCLDQKKVYKLDGSFRSVDSTVSKELSATSIKTTSLYIEYLKNSESLRVILEDMSESIRDLKTLPVISQMYKFEKDVIDVINCILFDHMFLNIEQPILQNEYSQLEIDESTLSRLQNHMSFCQKRVFSRNIWSFNLDTREKICSYLARNRENFSATRSEEIFAQLHCLDADEIISMWIRYNYRFDVIAVLSDKKLLNTPILKKIIKTRASYFKTNEPTSLWEAIKNLELKDQYELIEKLIFILELPQDFLSDPNYDKKKLTEIIQNKYNKRPYLPYESYLPLIDDESLKEKIILNKAVLSWSFIQNFPQLNIKQILSREKIALKWSKQSHRAEEICEFNNFNLDPTSKQYDDILLELANSSLFNFVSSYKSIPLSDEKLKEIILNLSKKRSVIDYIDKIIPLFKNDEKIALCKNTLMMDATSIFCVLKKLNIRDTKIISDFTIESFEKWNQQVHKDKCSFFYNLSGNIMDGVDYYPLFERILSEWTVDEVIQSLYKNFPASCIKRVLLELIDKIKEKKTIITTKNILTCTQEHPEILPEILVRGAGVPALNISSCYYLSQLPVNIQKEVAQKEADENPENFLINYQNYWLGSIEGIYDLIILAIKKLDYFDLDKFQIPDLKTEQEKINLYELLRNKSYKTSLQTILDINFESENLRFQYAKELVSDSYFCLSITDFFNNVKHLNLDQNQLSEILTVSSFSETKIKRQYPICKDSMEFFNECSRETRHAFLENSLNLMNQSFLLNFPLLKFEDQVFVIDRYLQRKISGVHNFVSIMNSTNIDQFFPVLIKIVKFHPRAVKNINFDLLSSAQIEAVVKAFFISLMKHGLKSSTTKIINIALLYFDGEKLERFAKKFIYDMIINSLSSKNYSLFNILKNTKNKLSHIDIVNKHFLRKEIKDNFEKNYSSEKCKQIIPEILHVPFSKIEKVTFLPLREKLVTFLLEISDHYEFNDVFKSNYNKNRYVKKAVQQIINIHNPQLKMDLIKIFFNQFFKREEVAQERLKHFKKLCEDKRVKDKAVLATLLLCSLQPSIEKSLIEKLSFSISSNLSLIKDRRNFTPFMEKLNLLLASDKIDNVKLLSIVDYYVRNFNGADVYQTLSLLQALIILDSCNDIDFKGKIDVKEILYIQNIKERLHIDDFDNDEFIKLFKLHFESYRDKHTIIKYIASQKNNEEILISLKSHIVDVLKGEYLQERYSLKNSVHLNTIFKNNEKALEEWKINTAVNAKPLLPPDHISQKREKISLFKQFREWIIDDKHISENDMKNKYQKLNEILSYEQMPEETVIEKAIVELNNNIKSTNEVQSILFQVKALSAIISKESILKSLKRLSDFLPEGSEFANNIHYLIQMQQSNHHIDFNTCIGQITDTPEDLLLMGSECGTCQRVDGDPVFNQGLMGVFNGKYKLVTIREEKSKEIYGRCLLKVLFDEKDNSGVLFMERIYVNSTDPTLKIALKNICKNKAKLMQMPLVAGECGNKAYPNPISSLQDRFGIEYVDNLGGIQNGEYTIKRCYYVD